MDCYILDAEGEAVKSTYEEYWKWKKTVDFDAIRKTRYVMHNVGVIEVTFDGLRVDGHPPFHVIFTDSNENYYGNVARFTKRKDAEAHAQALVKELGVIWDKMIDAVQKALPERIY